jgi:hypothetical protein
VNCVVSDWGPWSEWSAWAPISPTEERRTRTRKRVVITEPANGGTACPPLEETEPEIRTLPPLPPVELPPPNFGMQCSVRVAQAPPDMRAGWKSQLQRVTLGSTTWANVGTQDTSGDYGQLVTLNHGERIRLVWTFTGESARTTAETIARCGG